MWVRLLPPARLPYRGHMAPSFQQIREISYDQLIQIHDQLTGNTVVGIQYYLDELKRRDLQDVADRSERLAQSVHRLTAVSTFAAVVALLVSIMALVVALVK